MYSNNITDCFTITLNPHSRFGLIFKEAAEGRVIKTRHERFDASVMELKKDDLAGFVENLRISI